MAHDQVVERNAGRHWYLASTIKVPVAIAVLQNVEEGKLSLDQKVELLATDLVDGAGDLKTQQPGKRFTIAQLIGKSLENSDSIATDMLIRTLGEESFNRRLKYLTGGGIGPITKLLQVRYDVYGLLHPRVAELSNRTFLKMRAAGNGEARLQVLASALRMTRSELGTSSLSDLFERYYRTGTNSGRLDAMGELLTQLVQGDLLNEHHTDLVLHHMQRITTGARRIAATLPPDVTFAQKTGTQIERACNVGVLNPSRPSHRVVVAMCVERYGALSAAEQAFQSFGRALAEAGILD